MKIYLTGPNDLGHWFLTDDTGKSFTIVERQQDHAGAAALFGWVPCDCNRTDGTYDCPHTTAEQMIEDARLWLMDRIGDEIVPPLHIAEYFERPDATEVVTEFDGVRMRSTLEIVEEGPGELTFRIGGPMFEFSDEDEDEDA